ncbi:MULTISPECIES: glucose-1-phosphate adenylyltransferase [unclassified Paenibacillus]|uniref:glucose-1-phosphate adenylyltransferase n=1 Tax=unclassified Paenibacillus TaxID=185978 RepID=UPI000953F10D|nr:MULTISPECIES: glucose-1-phosphate adenylyltransferase [unclassified Paenibacillus]ASS64990.1 glucose-1-phosphate adenylyltransferase [Paenibacillus sp. RUD330]SIQ52206.1 glucose-1-phosphate adenylyltransferase [Paenibacillus sp. RU4X]SIQ74680.1 glucose-1-phosphate adenylyltransferase [Paenibacillus sp. RU4T]
MGHKEMIAMLLAGGEGKRLGVLTKDLAKPAVHFGGKYRIIDFTLSNCMHSGIDTVGVLTQYQPLELNRYLGIGSPWGLDRSDGGMAVLPPYVKSKGGDWYKGTANAIYQNMGFIDRYEPEYVLVISGDHIYKMDYEKMLEHHKELGADVTIAGLEVELKEASRFGTMHIGENCRVTDFEEKPKHPVSNVVSMGVYIFSWKVLQKYLILDEGDRKSSHDFGKDIIPRMLEDDIRLHMYPFKGYWKDVGTIDSLWEAHMDLLGAEPQLDLGGDEWRIYSARHNRPAHYVSPEASISDSLVTEGCVVEGVVERSVLFHGVEVGAGSFIRESVIMPGAIVGEGVKLYRAIVGEGAVIEPGVVMGSPDSPDIAVVGSDEKISRSPKMQEVEQP